MNRKYLINPLIAILLFGSLSLAQTFNHNTGTLQGTVFQNGYYGHGGLGVGGNGVIFGSNVDACFTAGIMIGNAANGIYGMVGSFTDVNNIVLIEDMENNVPITNFSLPNFDQVTTCQLTDGTPYGFEIDQTTYSNTGDDYIFIRYIVSNFSGSAINNIYVGLFCDWDVGGTVYLNNRGGIDVARNLVYQWEQAGSPDPSYYGIVAFSGMAGGTTTDAFPGDETTIRFVLRDWISTITTPLAITGDHRSFIGSGPYNIPTGSNIMVGFGIVAGDNLADLQANTDAAQVKWNNYIVPVELTSFTANVNNLGQVVLNWETATELNNLGFEIERRTESTEFRTIGYVEGYGTTTEPGSYSYIDKFAENGINYYRLKQIDFNGTYAYSDVVEVEVNGPLTFNLQQNYPNPFNPSTQIKYSVPESGNIRLSVFNIVGEEVAVLADGFTQAGFYEATFDASNLPSGVYVYKLQSTNSVQAKKMLLLK
jgi:hypothetical protein